MASLITIAIVFKDIKKTIENSLTFLPTKKQVRDEQRCVHLFLAHPLPLPSPTLPLPLPLRDDNTAPSQIHCLKKVVTDGPMDRRTDRRTDKRDAWTHLKRQTENLLSTLPFSEIESDSRREICI